MLFSNSSIGLPLEMKWKSDGNCVMCGLRKEVKIKSILKCAAEKVKIDAWTTATHPTIPAIKRQTILLFCIHSIGNGRLGRRLRARLSSAARCADHLNLGIIILAMCLSFAKDRERLSMLVVHFVLEWVSWVYCFITTAAASVLSAFIYINLPFFFSFEKKVRE